ncbi:hypothetical protein AJ79_09195 [Helicocarpus griseus UAMH5409]|uniref:Uncharacterized protein n=1 Tax=Helicocarpus griseus UAMH5409 TaxID=1447875 RepID=A0A2B7WLB0_9EURO|nr:hypothetical protein AJ79_09195 [Helicocarpus griseus UAMH5409]
MDGGVLDRLQIRLQQFNFETARDLEAFKALRLIKCVKQENWGRQWEERDGSKLENVSWLSERSTCHMSWGEVREMEAEGKRLGVPLALRWRWGDRGSRMSCWAGTRRMKMQMRPELKA